MSLQKTRKISRWRVSGNFENYLLLVFIQLGCSTTKSTAQCIINYICSIVFIQRQTINSSSALIFTKCQRIVYVYTNCVRIEHFEKHCVTITASIPVEIRVRPCNTKIVAQLSKKRTYYLLQTTAAATLFYKYVDEFYSQN